MATTLEQCLISDEYEGVCAKRMSPAEMNAAMARNKIRAERDMEARVRQHQLQAKVGVKLPQNALKSNNLFWGALIIVGAGLAYLYTRK